MTRYIRKEQEGHIKGRGTTEQVFHSMKMEIYAKLKFA